MECGAAGLNLIARRGVAREHLPAFVEAARRGYRAIVAQTADGMAVLMHDDTLERTARGRGQIADAPRRPRRSRR